MPSDKIASAKEKMYVSWHDTELQVKEIVDHMFVAHIHPEVILAIGFGGLIPAAKIAYHFGKRSETHPDIVSIYAQSYIGQKRAEVELLGSHVVAPAWMNSFEDRLLIVDDIADSGATLAHFKDLFPHAQTAALIHKEASSIVPDFCGHIDRDGDKWWYVFPWEQADLLYSKSFR